MFTENGINKQEHATAGSFKNVQAHLKRPPTFFKNQHSNTLDVSQALVTMATTIKELYVIPTLPSLLKLKQDVPCTVRSRAVDEETAEHLACNKSHHNHTATLQYIKLTHGLVYELNKCAVEQRVNTTVRHMTSTRDVFSKKPEYLKYVSHSVGDRTDIFAVQTSLYVPPIHFSTYSSYGLPLLLTNECV
jgi:hypothetical protein